MKKILTLGLLTVMLLSFSIMASAASDSSTTNFDTVVTNPFVEWVGDGFVTQPFFVDVAEGLENFYLRRAVFTVESTTTYDIELEIDASTWSDDVKMNINSAAVDHIQDFSSAFDVSILKRNNTTSSNISNSAQWTPWLNLYPVYGNYRKSSGAILNNQMNTLPTSPADDLVLGVNEFNHIIELALVLVESPKVTYASQKITPTAGYASTPDTRRFEELPNGTYNTVITVTVTEDFN